MANGDIRPHLRAPQDCDGDWHWITHQIALGAYPGREMLNELLAEGITAVVSACSTEPTYDVGAFAASHAVCQDDGFEFSYESLVGVMRFLHENIGAGRKVYVHCAMGVSRSAFLVAAYLMLAERISFDEAVSRVRAQRSVASPSTHLGSAAKLSRLQRERARILAGDAAEEN